jgi:F-type H+-transporting ATPase subunit delta
MASDKLARRYATALFVEAQHKDSLETIYGDMHLLNNTFDVSRELRAVFKNPIIHSIKKEQIADQLFKGKISSLSVDFIGLLLRERREAFLVEIIQQFFKLYNNFKGISEVTVTTAVEMDAAIEQNIETFVRKESGKPNVKINKKIDASIGGGFIVDFGDRLYDNSVRYKLNKLKKELSFN